MKVEEYIRDRESRGEIVNRSAVRRRECQGTSRIERHAASALAKVPYASLCPGAETLASMQEDFR